jgi:hypothetical protein
MLRRRRLRRLMLAHLREGRTHGARRARAVA